MKEQKVQVQAIVDRMKEVVGVSKDVELADALGASRSTPGVWKTRDRIPFAECMLIAEKHGVSFDWLVFGRDTPIKTQSGLDERAADSAGSLAYVEMQAFDMPSYPGVGLPQLRAKLPAAWINPEGGDAIEPIALRYVGNNMAPTIHDGDVLIVDRRPRDMDGVFVMRMGESVRVKRVQRMRGGALHLLNDNANYETEALDANQAGAVEFIGYCFAILRRLS
jgi:hypothetical protein